MTVKPLKTEEDYQRALQRLEDIFDALPNTEEGDELEVLSILIDAYEKQHHPIDLPDPVEAIKFRMDQLGLKQKDLVAIVGFKSRVSEILNRKRKLNLDMIRKLNQSLQIPTDVLIQDY